MMIDTDLAVSNKAGLSVICQLTF